MTPGIYSSFSRSMWWYLDYPEGTYSGIGDYISKNVLME